MAFLFLCGPIAAASGPKPLLSSNVQDFTTLDPIGVAGRGDSFAALQSMPEGREVGGHPLPVRAVARLMTIRPGA